MKTLYPEIPIIVLSGYSDEPISESDVEDSRYTFLQKPFTSGTLSRKVREIIDRNLPSTREESGLKEDQLSGNIVQP